MPINKIVVEGQKVHGQRFYQRIDGRDDGDGHEEGKDAVRDEGVECHICRRENIDQVEKGLGKEGFRQKPHDWVVD